MSKKKEKEWKQRLTAAMNAEAEEIEKQAEPFRAVLSEEKKAEIYQNIMEKIQEDEKTSSAADPLSEKKAAGAEELSSRRKTASRKSFWRQPLKLTGVLAAAVVLIFSMTLTSEGNRMYWLGRWRGLFGYDDVEQSNKRRRSYTDGNLRTGGKGTGLGRIGDCDAGVLLCAGGYEF